MCLFQICSSEGEKSFWWVDISSSHPGCICLQHWWYAEGNIVLQESLLEKVHSLYGKYYVKPDIIQILSNGIHESTLHRVVNCSPKYRVCVAYFYEVDLSFFICIPVILFTFLFSCFFDNSLLEWSFLSNGSSYQPNFDAAIEPLDICTKRTGGTKNYEPAVYGKHLVSKVLTNFVT